MKIPGTILRISRMEPSWKLTALTYQCPISTGYLSQIETGKAQPDPQFLRQLTKALDLDYTINPVWLFLIRQNLNHFVKAALFLDWEVVLN